MKNILIILTLALLGCRPDPIVEPEVSQEVKLISRDWHDYKEGNTYYHRFSFNEDGTGYAIFSNDRYLCDTAQGPFVWSLQDTILTIDGMTSSGINMEYFRDINILTDTTMQLQFQGDITNYYPYSPVDIGRPPGICN